MTASSGTARMIAVAGGLGAASGVLCYLVPEALDLAGINVVEWLLRLVPGIIFGVAVGLSLGIVGATTMWRAAAFVPLETAAWYAALWFAISAPQKLGFPFSEMWQLGIASGLIGASLVALSALLLFPFFRRRNLVAATIAVGGAAGALLGFGDNDLAIVVLFTIWQGAVAACFGWGVARAKGTS